MKEENATPAATFSSSLSVDCVVFGFDGSKLHVLLVAHDGDPTQAIKHKIPGSMIYDHEDIDTAASRVLETVTGLSNIYLKHLHVFSSPHRISGEALRQTAQHYQITTNRIITVAYYALVKLNERLIRFTTDRGAQWISIDAPTNFALDHKDILICALNRLTQEFRLHPIAFELLPRYFTLRQFQNLYQAILGTELDRRNFRKKVKQSSYIIPTDKKETGVAHKPARYYTFNKSEYKKNHKTNQHFF